jgi:hypothetical protein
MVESGCMATLKLRSGIGNIPTSYECSDCAKVFPMPSEESADENKRMLEEQFKEHVATEHLGARGAGK